MSSHLVKYWHFFLSSCVFVCVRVWIPFRGGDYSTLVWTVSCEDILTASFVHVLSFPITHRRATLLRVHVTRSPILDEKRGGSKRGRLNASPPARRHNREKEQKRTSEEDVSHIVRIYFFLVCGQNQEA